MATNTPNDGTIGKALDVLELVADAGRPVRFTDVLAKSSLPRATLFRFLRRLTNQRMLTYDNERHTYNLGLRLVCLAHNAWKQSSLGTIAAEKLDELSAQVGETIHLAQMENGQVVYIDKRSPAYQIDMFSQTGKVGPAYCTGVGKAILAFLDETDQERALKQQSYYAFTDNTLTCPKALAGELKTVRAEGIAFDREEHEPGIICIASPIRTNTKVVGAVSITSTVQRHSFESLAPFRPALEETARGIGDLAKNWQFPELV